VLFLVLVGGPISEVLPQQLGGSSPETKTMTLSYILKRASANVSPEVKQLFDDKRAEKKQRVVRTVENCEDGGSIEEDKAAVLTE
jgi:hypothetical protein